ncbi:MAG: SxtJ family membrane protein [Verrucomicrobiota bacterium]
MIEIDWKPKEKVLRQFGWICLPGFGLVGLVVAWHLGCFEGSGRWTPSCVLWGIGVLSWLTGLVAPRCLKWLFVGMMLVAFPIGMVVGTVILLLLFFLLFTPLALVFKVIGRDEMQRSVGGGESSYWIKIDEKRAPASYYRQF